VLRPSIPRARRAPRWLAPLLILGLVGGLAGGCKARSSTGELTPPNDAVQWDARYAETFDDDYTRQALNLRGRAPHDVRDQRLLAARLGHADVIAEVKVLQVWGRGRYQGRQEQFLELEIEKILMGELVKGTADRQFLAVKAEDELPGALQGQSLLLFLRWAPGQAPPFRHHLMPVEPEAMGYIAAVIEHAKAEGVLDAEGVPARSGRKGRTKSKKSKRKQQAAAAE
jgi:hypothetical protein